MIYKRFLVVFCLLVGMAGGILAQQSERNAMKVVVFNNLTYVKPEQEKGVISVLGTIADVLLTGQNTQQKTSYQEALRATIVKGISQGHRITLMDGTGMSQANWYVDGTVSNISTTTKIEKYKDNKGKEQSTTWYKAQIGVTLHVKDAQTNQILASPMFKVSDEDLAWITTPDEAINNALQSLSSRITDYFNRWLPLHANIIEGARDKKDKQKEVYIDLGNDTKGVYRGLRFGVYTTKIVAGKEAKRQIGKLKITDIQGGDISLCKVQSGGKDIKAAIDAGETLLVTSIK